MKKLFLSLGTVMFYALSILAQTPYDNFAPEQSVKTMIEMPQMQFKVMNTDRNSKIRYVELDKNNLSVNLFNDEGSIIKTVQLNPDDKKFTTMDRFAEKYYSISPYAYCANNPLKYIDPTGDTIQVMDNGVNYYYQQDRSGNYGFYDVSGNAYSGNSFFIRDLSTALTTLGTSTEGMAIITELQTSTNMFTIQQAVEIDGTGNKFIPNDIPKAYANQTRTDPAYATSYAAITTAGVNLSGGSGGIVKWNPLGGNVQTATGVDFNPATNLGHELAHGVDANQGKSDDRLHNGLSRNEWQGTYRENLIRSQLPGVPARTHYGRTPMPFTPTGVPIRPSWY